MKNYIFIFITFISIQLYSQNDFPTSNAIWNINFINSGGSVYGGIIYGIKGDTIINDTIYNKLYTLSDTSLTDESLLNYIGGFRQTEEQVWFKPAAYNNAPNMILLYDFSASVGDTVWHNGDARYANIDYPSFSNTSFYSIVEEKGIDEIGTYIYAFNSCGPYSTWYKGIGSIEGLFGSIVKYPLLLNTYNLACLKHNDMVKYNNNAECPQCFCLTSDNNIEVSNDFDNIIIYPNPTNEKIHISDAVPQSYYAIYDIYGKEICTGILNNNKTIDVSNFNSGLYYIRINLKDKSSTGKFIVN